MKSIYSKRSLIKGLLFTTLMMIILLSGFSNTKLIAIDLTNFEEDFNNPGPKDSTWVSAYFTFNINPDDPYTAYFTDQSTGSVSDWYWDFGDNTFSTLQNPSRTYQSAGIYNVCLTVTGDSVNYSDTYCIEIVIAESPSCMANFTYEADSAPSGAYLVQFTDISTGEIEVWTWDFGDGSSSTEQNPLHMYFFPGTYNVCLTIMGGDSLGYYSCFDTYCMEINLGQTNACMADFTYLINPPNTGDFTVQFTDLSVGAIDNWFWNFGDGNTSTQQNPLHQFDGEGTYNVCLTIIEGDTMSPNYCYDMVCYEITVGQGSSCMAAFTYTIDTMPSGGSWVQFTDLSVGEIEEWFWDFGDGSSSTEQNPAHQYDNPGLYYVCLTIMGGDSLGMITCNDTHCEEIFIGQNTSCVANFTYSVDSANNGYLVQFTDLSIGQIDSWYWVFGDNSTSTEQNPSHIFYEPGSYNVCLTIMGGDSLNGNWCYDTYCEEIIVGQGNSCIANFTYVVDSINPYTVHFFDLSVGNITNWSWEFGDGTTSNEPSPTHTFNADDTFNVCLTVFSEPAICYDTYCEPVTVGCPPCMANFYYMADSANQKTVYFFDNSSGIISEWQWDFGDGSTAAGQNVIHTYQDEGTYNVCLTVISACSYCFDTYCEEIIIDVPEFYNLGGTVFADYVPIDEGFAYAYQLEGDQIVDVNASFISQYGYYDFFQIESSSYIVKSELSPNSAHFGNFVPTYFGDVYNWAEASAIDLQNNNWDADISLLPVNQTYGGNGAISGMVTYANKEVTVASGVELLLLNESDEIVGIIFTDETGQFTFSNLSMGTYGLLVEITGIHALPASITLDEENPVHENITFVVHDQMVTLSVQEGLPQYVRFLGGVYPNPVSQNANISLVSEEIQKVDLRLFGITGQQMNQTEILLKPGDNILQVPTQSLDDGFYYLQITFEGKYSVTRKLVKMK
ncbi:MAG: PKD domain-containing protein [Bacteroidales bacterium]|nr:PKD domain-containing protein [Bacteroidales bacterium]